MRNRNSRGPSPIGPWTPFYVLFILFINWTVYGIGDWDVLGAKIPPALFAAGVVFVLRDFSQQEIGQRVLVATLLAAAGSYFVAGGWIALASAIAFVISETVDQIVFTILRKPLKDRILISSACSVPIDSFVFLQLIERFTLGAFLIACIIKMVASLAIWLWLRHRDAPDEAPAPDAAGGTVPGSDDAPIAPRHEISVRFARIGFHRWPDAPPHRSYLSERHRHTFRFKVSLEVRHRDREVEFHDLSDWLQSLYGPGPLEFGDQSCETIGHDLYRHISQRYPGRSVRIEVSEDGEYTSEATYPAHVTAEPVS
ncbi:VUT family protein [Bradyrhizobium sp. P5_C11_2]